MRANEARQERPWLQESIRDEGFHLHSRSRTISGSLDKSVQPALWMLKIVDLKRKINNFSQPYYTVNKLHPCFQTVIFLNNILLRQQNKNNTEKEKSVRKTGKNVQKLMGEFE